MDNQSHLTSNKPEFELIKPYPVFVSLHYNGQKYLDTWPSHSHVGLHETVATKLESDNYIQLHSK